ncbi:MAG: alpha/beta hydrolase [Congregibacter sp.]
MAAPSNIALNNGELSFSAKRCGEGPVVFCLHGFPDNLHTFDAQLPALAAAGFTAIAPAMRGYEPSSQPQDSDYSVEAMAGDIIAWADELGAERFHLIGHDWGAAVSYVAGALYPERIQSLATLALPHAANFGDGLKKVPVQSLKSWYITFFQFPGFAELATRRNDWALIRKLWRDWSPGYELSDAEWQQLRDTFNAPGVLKGMLSYYRQNASLPKLLGWTDSAMRRLKTVGVPTLALTGSDDGCIDTRLFDHIMGSDYFPAGVRVERLAGLGHFLHRESPERVNPLLLDWLGAQSKA